MKFFEVLMLPEAKVLPVKMYVPASTVESAVRAAAKYLGVAAYLSATMETYWAATAADSICLAEGD